MPITVSIQEPNAAEIESALGLHPTVAEAAVVGFPHEIKGEGIYAYVTLMDGEIPSEELKTLLSNLINNSIEASATKITIYVQKNQLLIQDDGKGIPNEICQRLLSEPLSYGKGALTNGSGNGIGLYSAYHTLKSVGGDLILKSEENVGTSITLVF
jgi:signal transduction histidine kinase